MPPVARWAQELETRRYGAGRELNDLSISASGVSLVPMSHATAQEVIRTQTAMGELLQHHQPSYDLNPLIQSHHRAPRHLYW